MIDIKLIRENPEMVKENIKKKFQDKKLVLVDEIVELDTKIRELKKDTEDMRAMRNSSSKEIGLLMRNKEIEAANKLKAEMKDRKSTRLNSSH